LPSFCSILSIKAYLASTAPESAVDQNQIKKIKSKTILLQTPIVYTEVTLTWKVLEFVYGKPTWTNPAIMGNPINVFAVNDS